jgi:general secretion pathway protein D
MNLYKFDGNSGGIGRIGFRGTESPSSIVDPAGDLGAILGFGAGGSVHVKFSGQDYTVPSLLSFIQLAKAVTNSNVLSTPQVMALNNEEALIEVGDVVPVQQNNSIGANGVASTAPTREPITTKLTITPFISPDTDSVKLKLDQEVGSLATVTIKATELAKNAIATSKRKIKTNIVVNSGDTAVLGGLMKDSDEETVNKIPILGDIPVLGWLFKSNSHQKEKTNLMVFITPQIIRNEEDNDKLLSDKLSERIDFITRSMSGRDPHGAYVDALPRRKASNAAPKTPPSDPADAVDAMPSPTPAPEEPATETF